MSEGTGAGPARRSSRRKVLADVAALLALFIVAVGTWHVVSPQSSPINYFLTPEVLPAVPRARRPETLGPALFTGKVAEGYRIARERPALLERLPCYCGCYLNAGHQNNLDCFRDRHGETCDMCVEIALEAERLTRAGYGAADIKAIVDRRFAPRKGHAME